MDAKDAKLVCECRFLGLEREGMTPDVHPDVVGVGIGHRTVRGFPTEGLALKVYVRQKIHPLLVKDGRTIPDEIEGVPTDIEEAGEFSIWRPIPPIYQRKVRPPWAASRSATNPSPPARPRGWGRTRGRRSSCRTTTSPRTR